MTWEDVQKTYRDLGFRAATAYEKRQKELKKYWSNRGLLGSSFYDEKNLEGPYNQYGQLREEYDDYRNDLNQEYLDVHQDYINARARGELPEQVEQKALFRKQALAGLLGPNPSETTKWLASMQYPELYNMHTGGYIAEGDYTNYDQPEQKEAKSLFRKQALAGLLGPKPSLTTKWLASMQYPELYNMHTGGYIAEGDYTNYANILKQQEAERKRQTDLRLARVQPSQILEGNKVGVNTWEDEMIRQNPWYRKKKLGY